MDCGPHFVTHCSHCCFEGFALETLSVSEHAALASVVSLSKVKNASLSQRDCAQASHCDGDVRLTLFVTLKQCVNFRFGHVRDVKPTVEFAGQRRRGFARGHLRPSSIDCPKKERIVQQYRGTNLLPQKCPPLPHEDGSAIYRVRPWRGDITRDECRWRGAIGVFYVLLVRLSPVKPL